MQKTKARRYWWVYALWLVIFAAIGIRAMLAPSIPTVPPPTLDRDQAWATQIIWRASATVNAANNPFYQAFGAISSYLFPPSLTPTYNPNSPSIIVVTSTGQNPFASQLTATFIIRSATETQGAALTATNNARHGYTQLPGVMTATSSIRNVTETQVAVWTATSNARRGITQSPSLTPTMTSIYTPTPDAAQQTATRIIEMATAYVQGTLFPTSTPTPIPTQHPPLTTTELQLLRQRWLSELETTADFYHPVFEQIVDELVRSAPNISAGYVRRFRLNSAVERVEREGSNYVALVTTTSFLWAGFSNLYIFRVTDNVPTLLPDVLNMNGMFITFWGLRYSNGDYLGGFQDRNRNGYLDLAIDTDGGGSCGVQQIILLEIGINDQLTVISSGINGMARNLVDINGDGMTEIEVMSYTGSPMAYGCHSLMVPLYYAWNGVAYENITPTLDESYYPVIAEYWVDIGAEDTCLMPDPAMYQMLNAYVALGRLEEGWTRILPHIQQCPLDMLMESPDLVALENWVMSQLHPVTPTATP